VAFAALLLLSLVRTADAEPAPTPAPAPGLASEEITVWGDAVERAHQVIVDQIVDLGYGRVKRRGDRLVFKQDMGWKGKVVLYDDGRLETLRRGLSWRKVDPIPGTRIRPYFLCAIQPTYCVDFGGTMLSDRRWGQVEDRVARGTASALVAFGDRVADASVAEQLETLPDRFDALWRDGVPLTGAPDARLATFQERRAALLVYWDSRTETPWGMQVREAVAAFVRAEVQASDHPFTPTEREVFDAVRRSSSPFPWEPEATAASDR
jgi:hypothetical protein